MGGNVIQMKKIIVQSLMLVNITDDLIFTTSMLQLILFGEASSITD